MKITTEVQKAGVIFLFLMNTKRPQHKLIFTLFLATKLQFLKMEEEPPVLNYNLFILSSTSNLAPGLVN